jgi:Xaa-Pro aminopeptidase
MVKDGVAWVKTLNWIENQVETRRTITEMDVAEKIAEFRAGREHYMGESFHPISSFGYHGAVVHYSVTPESSIPLEPGGIFLLDTGGQFLDGTTDTTRTIALGQPTSGQKTDFTLALKGTLAVSMLRFPAGTRGYQLDVLARMALWLNGKNYGHGTGHGVGFFLNVHEGPQTIGTSASGYLQVTLDPGMVTTVEPAIYKEGQYGMRTENMTLIVPDIQTDYGSFLRFETLTLVPVDLKLIEVRLLSALEKEWINLYHKRVYNELAPYLDSGEKSWLAAATQPL